MILCIHMMFHFIIVATRISIIENGYYHLVESTLFYWQSLSNVHILLIDDSSFMFDQP